MEYFFEAKQRKIVECFGCKLYNKWSILLIDFPVIIIGSSGHWPIRNEDRKHLKSVAIILRYLITFFYSFYQRDVSFVLST